MPKLKLTEEEEKRIVLRARVEFRQEKERLDDEAVAVKIHVSKRTFRNKKKHPDTFKADELWRLCKVLKFTDAEKAEIL